MIEVGMTKDKAKKADASAEVVEEVTEVASSTTVVRARGLDIGEAFEEVLDEVMDFPVMWRDRACLMNCWLCTSLLTLVFSPFAMPGALLGFMGAALHVCRCCRPGSKFAGKRTSKIIFIIALFATAFDLAMGVVLTVLASLYLALGCVDSEGGELDETLCDWRKMFAIIILLMVAVTFLHFVTSFLAFVSMRDCHLDIHRFECHHLKMEKEELEDHLEEEGHHYHHTPHHHRHHSHKKRRPSSRSHRHRHTEGGEDEGSTTPLLGSKEKPKDDAV